MDKDSTLKSVGSAAAVIEKEAHWILRFAQAVLFADLMLLYTTGHGIIDSPITADWFSDLDDRTLYYIYYPPLYKKIEEERRARTAEREAIERRVSAKIEEQRRARTAESEASAKCSGAQTKCGGREIQDQFQRRLFETEAELRRTLSETQRKLVDTDARS